MQLPSLILTMEGCEISTESSDFEKVDGYWDVMRVSWFTFLGKEKATVHPRSSRTSMWRCRRNLFATKKMKRKRHLGFHFHFSKRFIDFLGFHNQAYKKKIEKRSAPSDRRNDSFLSPIMIRNSWNKHDLVDVVTVVAAAHTFLHVGSLERHKYKFPYI